MQWAALIQRLPANQVMRISDCRVFSLKGIISIILPKALGTSKKRKQKDLEAGVRRSSLPSGRQAHELTEAVVTCVRDVQGCVCHYFITQVAGFMRNHLLPLPPPTVASSVLAECLAILGAGNFSSMAEHATPSVQATYITTQGPQALRDPHTV